MKKQAWLCSRAVSFFLLVAFLAAQATAQPAPQHAPQHPRYTTPNSGEQRAAAYMESVRANPLLLAAFLRAMPKGGDLHNHLSGAVYAESYIKWAAQDGDCVDRATLAFIAPPCDEAAGKPPATKALTDGAFYNQLIDALSMRHFVSGISSTTQSGEDHFFATFSKFGRVSSAHVGEMLAEVVNRAASQNVQYLELTLNPERGQAEAIGRQVGWDDNLDSLRQKMDAAGTAAVVDSARKFLDKSELQMRETFNCKLISAVDAGSPELFPKGCRATVRYIYEVYRLLPREQLFAQALVGFELAAADPRVVSVNPVQPEDAHASMENYDLTMKIFAYLHKQFPQVKLTMHAGELGPGQVPLAGLSDHIRKAIEVAGAERIGHGTDIMWEVGSDAFLHHYREAQPFDLLHEMRKRNVLVEISLSSSDYILGLRGGDHPLPIYLKYGVPVALATDDEGVSRSDITHEYLRATQTYGLKYGELKKLARNSIEHAFADDATRAKLLQQLEDAFSRFEKTCCAK